MTPRASDIHLEATRDGLRDPASDRRRAHRAAEPARGLQAAVVSRVKLLAELDIAERRAPQDGRIRVRLESRELDLRVSTVPTLFGESVVLRLLDRGGRPVRLEDLGLQPGMLDPFAARWPGSRTASSSPPAPPAAARPRLSTPRSASGTRPQKRSSPSRTRWSTTSPASPRCRCTPRPA